MMVMMMMMTVLQTFYQDLLRGKKNKYVLKVYGQFRVCCGCLIVSKLDNVKIYRVIHKSIRDFRPLRYSSRDGHTEGEHVNRGTDTPSFYPTLQVLDMSKLGDVADVNPAKSKTQNAFVFTVHAMFRHDCPLAVKPASTPRRLVHTHKKKLGVLLYLLICSFLLCLSWLLWRDL